MSVKAENAPAKAKKNKKVKAAKPEPEEPAAKKVKPTTPDSKSKANKKTPKHDGAKSPKDKDAKLAKADKVAGKKEKAEKVKAGQDNGEDRPAKKPMTAEEQKAARIKAKALKVERQKKSAKSESIYELGVQTKKIWEKVRSDKCPEDEKAKLIVELHELVKGQLKNIIYSHDTVRVVETLLSLGTHPIREAILDELKDEILKMAKSKYATFLVGKLLKYGDKTTRLRLSLIFQGNVPELMKHKTANLVVEAFYNDYATTQQRNNFLQEFCGPEFRKFKEPEIATAKALTEKYPEKATFIVRYLQECTNILIAKGCYNTSLVHRVIYEYSTLCKPEDRADLITQLRDVVVHIVHTEYGAKLSEMVIKHGTAKDRKSLIKSLKTFVPKICCEEVGYRAMIALLDSVDDTKLVGKAVLGEITESLEEIAENPHGRKVLMFAVAGKNKKYTANDVIERLNAGGPGEHSKKDPEIRAREIRAAISPALAKYCVEKMDDLLKENNLTVFLTCLLNHGDNEAFAGALAHLAELAAQPFSSDDDEQSLVERTATHMMLKKLIAHDKERAEGEKLFTSALLEALDDDSMDCYLNCNRGCFLMVRYCNNFMK